jgi:hypothetical protein
MVTVAMYSIAEYRYMIFVIKYKKDMESGILNRKWGKID